MFVCYKTIWKSLSNSFPNLACDTAGEPYVTEGTSSQEVLLSTQVGTCM